VSLMQHEMTLHYCMLYCPTYHCPYFLLIVLVVLLTQLPFGELLLLALE
jgi:hypothetical protein